jgi:hypothetical protein
MKERVQVIRVCIETHFLDERGKYDMKMRSFDLDPESIREVHVTETGAETYFISGRVKPAPWVMDAEG